MAQITLKIVGNVNDVQQKISLIKADLASIGQKPIQIKVEATGVDAVTKEMIQYAKYTAQATAEERKLETQKAKTAQATAKQATEEAKVSAQREKTAQATQKRISEEAKLATQMEKTATAEEQSRRANTQLSQQIEKTNTVRAEAALQAEKTATSEANLALQQEKTRTAEISATAAREKATNEAKNLGEAAETAAKSNSLLGDSLTHIAAKMAVWQLMGTAVSKVIGSFRDALATMKEVDAQLTNIQKVSGASAAEIERIGDAAYETASKYGVAADEYLSAVYTFQKAGLGDSAEKLGELATKTMLVGDTTAEVASKFLIAVNAAWNLGGSMESLSKVVDEADYINNNYATSLDKLSAGMPIVASTAANMNMSIEETLAVLGTITAATQETGTKAATAWRALVMNITGEIGEITDETGETIEVTEESVKSISDALKIYGNDAVKAAQESGRLIDPMEAVISLAEAYKDGLLNDIELENILMSVGGKLRTNQLTALVKDLASETSTYYDIMSKLPEAAGTADSEISIMLSSWESKTQILKNTWTEFLSHLIDTDGVKTALEVLTRSVEALDTDFGRAVVTILAVSAALTAVGKAATNLMGGGLISGIYALTTAIGAATTATGVFTAVWNASPFLIVTAAVAAVYGIVKLVDALVVTQEEYTSRVQDSVDAYKAATAELDSLNTKLQENRDLIEAANKNGDNDSYVKRLENENTLLEAQINLQKELAKKEEAAAAKSAMEALTSGSGYKIKTGDQSTFSFVPSPGAAPITTSVDKYEDVGIVTYTKYLLDQAEAGENVSEALLDVFQSLTVYRSALRDTAQDADGWNNNEREYAEILDGLLERYNALYESTEKENRAKANVTKTDEQATESADGLSKAQEALNKAYAAGEAEYTTLKTKLEPIITAYGELAENGKLTEATTNALTEAFPELRSNITRTADGFVIATDALDGFVDEAINSTTQMDNLSVAGKSLYAIYQDLYAALDPVTDALVELDNEGVISEATIKNLLAVYPELEKHIQLTADGYVIEKSDLENLISAKRAEYQLTFNNAVNAARTQISALSAEANAWNMTTQEVKKYIMAKENALQAEASVATTGAHRPGTGGKEVLNVGEDIAPGLTAAQQAELKAYQTALANIMDAERAAGSFDSLLAQISGGSLNDYGGGSGKTGGSSGRSGSSSSTTDTALEKLKDIVSLRKQELSFLEASGASTDEQTAKMREIQQALNAQAEYMRSAKADKKDILSVSTEWWQYENKINDLLNDQLDKLKAEVSLRESELDFLEASGKSEEEQIKKIREIQDVIHREADYLRSIKADQTEINALSTKWWQLENQIASLQEQIQKRQDEILGSLADALDDYLKSAEDALTGPLQDQLDALKAQKDAISDAREEEEKLLAVEKARIALENAQRERTVRQYNAATGQWEWVADSKAVQSAQDDLADAEQALDDFYRNRAIKDLEKQIGNIEDAFGELRDAISYVSDAIRSGAMTYAEAYAYIDDKMRGIYDDYGVDLTGVIQEAMSGFGTLAETALSLLSQVYAAAKAAGDADSMEAANRLANQIRGAGDIVTATEDIAKTRMQANSAAWANASASEREALAAENLKIGTSLGWTRGADGIWYDANGNRAYDSGGILRGMGGIKATRADEMILPPSITRGLLDAEKSGAFEALLNHLGIVTSAAQSYAGFGGGITKTNIGKQINGGQTIFNVGGVELKNITESTTMGEFLRQVKTLSLYSGGQ